MFPGAPPHCVLFSFFVTRIQKVLLCLSAVWLFDLLLSQIHTAIAVTNLYTILIGKMKMRYLHPPFLFVEPFKHILPILQTMYFNVRSIKYVSKALLHPRNVSKALLCTQACGGLDHCSRFFMLTLYACPLTCDFASSPSRVEYVFHPTDVGLCHVTCFGQRK